MLCRDVMKKTAFASHESDTAAECAKLMRDHNVGFVPVVNGDGRVVGVVTDRDLALRVLSEKKAYSTSVSVVMTPDVRICHPEDNLKVAEEKMAKTKKSRLVVVDEGGRCVGVISLSDIAQADSRARAGQVLYAVTQREAVRPT